MGISDKDRKILWARSGNRCAWCREVLIVERTSADDESVVGDEAHITAQSPGGPRYGECAPGTVDSYENLILLCKVHHKMVDDQPQYFTAVRLRQIKAEHEAWVERTLGVEPGATRDDLGDPLIARIDKPLTVLTVDGDPPKQIPGSNQVHVITLAGRSDKVALELRAMQPVVLDRRRPRRVCTGETRIGAWVPPRPFVAELDPGEFDHGGPVLKALRSEGRIRDFPFSVTSTNIERFEIRPRVTTGEVAWILKLDWWTSDGRAGTTIIDDDGKPFELYPTAMLNSDPGLRWGCGFGGHRPDCPEEQLAALRRIGVQANPSQAELDAAAIEEEFPDWSVWRSDAGIWYATPVGARAGGSGMEYSDTAEGLRLRLRKGRP